MNFEAILLILFLAFCKVVAEAGFKKLFEYLDNRPGHSTEHNRWLNLNQVLIITHLLTLVLLVTALGLGVTSYWQRVFSPQMPWSSFKLHFEHTYFGISVVGFCIWGYNYCMQRLIAS